MRRNFIEDKVLAKPEKKYILKAGFVYPEYHNHLQLKLHLLDKRDRENADYNLRKVCKKHHIIFLIAHQPNFRLPGEFDDPVHAIQFDFYDMDLIKAYKKCKLKTKDERILRGFLDKFGAAKLMLQIVSFNDFR